MTRFDLDTEQITTNYVQVNDKKIVKSKLPLNNEPLRNNIIPVEKD